MRLRIRFWFVLIAIVCPLEKNKPFGVIILPQMWWIGNQVAGRGKGTVAAAVAADIAAADAMKNILHETLTAARAFQRWP
jgi:hypothetical protein